MFRYRIPSFNQDSNDRGQIEADQSHWLESRAERNFRGYLQILKRLSNQEDWHWRQEKVGRRMRLVAHRFVLLSAQLMSSCL